MRTLIIVSHPTIETSLNQQFFKEATENLTVTWHHLENITQIGRLIVIQNLNY